MVDTTAPNLLLLVAGSLDSFQCDTKTSLSLKMFVSPRANLIFGRSTLSVLRKATDATGRPALCASVISPSAILLLFCRDVDMRTTIPAFPVGCLSTETHVRRVARKCLQTEQHAPDEAQKKHALVHIYIYMYMCVCVCVSIQKNVHHDDDELY